MESVQTIAIIGSGVVGYATGRILEELGHSVRFFDINHSVIDRLRAHGHKAHDIAELNTYHSGANFFFVCVPTPFSKARVETSMVMDAVTRVARVLPARAHRDNPAVVAIRSTVPVGTHAVCAHRISTVRPDLVLDTDVALCSFPEYLREHSSLADARTPRAIIIGSNNTTAAKRVAHLYRHRDTPVFFVTPEEAEMHKYVHNLFNACKISFFNEMRDACAQCGVDADTIFPLVVRTAEAIWNPLYGTHNRGAFGGSCLPKDTRGFLQWAHARAITMPLLRAIIEVNDARRARNAPPR